MNSNVSKNKKSQSDFPCLMEYNNEKENSYFVVLFSKDKTGTVVYKEGNCKWNLGEYSATWAMNCFKLFKGEIKLSN